MSSKYFIGFDVSDEVKDQAERIIEESRHLAPEAEWTPREKMHITVMFVGTELAPTTLPRIRGALNVLPPFEACIGALGSFSTRTLFLGLVEAYAMLNVTEVRKQLAVICKARAGDWKPHLTLAKGTRVPTPYSLSCYTKGIVFPVKELHLYKTIGGGKPYEVIETFTLKNWS